MTRRFAEDTRVPVSRTLEDVKAQLRRAGADNIAVFEGAAKSAVGFTAEGRMYRIDVPRRVDAPSPEQEERRAWRLVLLLIKAKLEAVREGATTIEREFFADMLTPDGRTLHQVAAPELALAYEKGVMPERLLLGGPAG